MHTNGDLISLVTWGSGGGPFPRVAGWLATGLRELGVRFDAVYLEGPAGVHANCSVREIRLGSGRAHLSLPALARYFRQARPSLTLVHPSYIAPFALAAGRLTSQCVVPWEGAFPSRELTRLPLRMRMLPALQRTTYPWAPAIATKSLDVAAASRTLLGRRGAERPVWLLPNPVHADAIRRLASEPASRSKLFRLCTVGRLSWEKGLDVLIDALAFAAPNLPDWELILIGDGPQKAELQRHAHARGLADRILFSGRLENPYPLMGSADVLVHPARWEGFGLAVGEALALGVPVVATTCAGGPHEILDEGRFGVLVPPEQPQALATALLAVAEDSNLRRSLATRGPERAREYAPRVIAAQLLSDFGRLSTAASN